MLGTTLLLEFF